MFWLWLPPLAAAASGLPKKNEGVVATVVALTRLDRQFPALNGGIADSTSNDVRCWVK
jgi:hypothetical protein